MTSLANFPTFPVPCHFVERRVNKRKRKKHLITELKKQVSFYFSDSNLSKDKYLRDMIQQDVNGYVSVNQISSFNKVNNTKYSAQMLKSPSDQLGGYAPQIISRPLIKPSQILEISSDEKLLLRAISEIPWLEFSADEQSVRRSTPINYLYCADDRYRFNDWILHVP